MPRVTSWERSEAARLAEEAEGDSSESTVESGSGGCSGVESAEPSDEESQSEHASRGERAAGTAERSNISEKNEGSRGEQTKSATIADSWDTGWKRALAVAICIVVRRVWAIEMLVAGESQHSRPENSRIRIRDKDCVSFSL